MKVPMMSARTHTQIQTHKTEVHSVDLGRPSRSATPLSPSIQRACTLINKDDYIGAANLLAAAGRDPQTRNAQAVCLMRAGRFDAAVDVYRSFILVQGSLLERKDVSNAYKRNFATALLMKGLPSGALAVLKATGEPNHPMAIQLYGAIKRWEKSLSWLKRMDWKFNAIEPRKCIVPMDFEPGEFDFYVERQRPAKPETPANADPKVAA